MKPRPSNQRNQAWNLIEVFLVIFVLAVLAMMLLPIHTAARRRADRTNCANNLKQVSSAYGIWETDRSLPASGTNDAAMDLTKAEESWNHFLSQANALGSTKIFHCPADTNLDGKISYFFNLSASARYPQSVQFGDDNLAVGDPAHTPQFRPIDGVAEGEIPAKSGLVEILTNTPMAWMETRHLIVGNIAYADGSVSITGNNRLQEAFQQSGLVTNWLVIP